MHNFPFTKGEAVKAPMQIFFFGVAKLALPVKASLDAPRSGFPRVRLTQTYAAELYWHGLLAFNGGHSMLLPGQPLLEILNTGEIQ